MNNMEDQELIDVGLTIADIGRWRTTEAKKPRGKKEKTFLTFQSVTVPADIIGILAIHRPLDGENGWVVTHTGTLGSVSWFRTKKEAKTFCDTSDLKC